MKKARTPRSDSTLRNDLIWACTTGKPGENWHARKKVHVSGATKEEAKAEFSQVYRDLTDRAIGREITACLVHDHGLREGRALVAGVA